MDNRGIMQAIMIGLLLISGYIYLLQSILRRSVNKQATPLIAIALLVMYAAVSAIVLMMLSTLGSMEMILMGLLVLLAGTVMMISLFGIFRYFRDLKKGWLTVFLLYLLGIAYISIFSRSESRDAVIRMVPFASLKQTGAESGNMLNHMLLNVAMFVPMGVLLPMICPTYLSRWSYILGIGLMSTVAIEAIQLVLALGQCDIDDIIANVLGAVAGYLVYLGYTRYLAHREIAE